MLEQLRNLLQPLTNIMARPFMSLHPNVISILSIFFFFPGLYFYTQGDSLLGSLFVIGAASDAIDGTVARATSRTSQFGGILDATIDRFTEGLLPMAIGMGGLVDWSILFMFFNLSVCISYIKAKAEAASGVTKVGKNKFSVGITQRGDRLAVVFIASILNYFLTRDSNDILTYSIVVLTILCAITVVWRGFVIWQVVDQETKTK